MIFSHETRRLLDNTNFRNEGEWHTIPIESVNVTDGMDFQISFPEKLVLLLYYFDMKFGSHDGAHFVTIKDGAHFVTLKDGAHFVTIKDGAHFVTIKDGAHFVTI